MKPKENFENKQPVVDIVHPKQEMIDALESDELKQYIADLQARMVKLEKENEQLEKICSDIDELRERDELHRTIFNSTGTSMVLIEEDMTIAMANHQFLSWLDISREEVEGRLKWTEIFPVDKLEWMIEQHSLRRDNPDQAQSTYEFRFIGKDGNPEDVLANILIMPGTNKSIASLINITDLKKTQRKLEVSEEKFRTLAEFSPVAIMMHQGDHWIYANRAACVISGFSEEEFCAQKFWDIVHPDYRELIQQFGRKRQEGGAAPQSYEFIITTKGGEEKWVRLTGNRIKYEDRPTALVSVMDITHSKQAEADRRKLESQLQQAQKLESVGRLAGGVAHDFNNMLGVILGHAQLALMGMDEKNPLKSCLNEITKAAERSADLTRQLLAFARKQTVALKVLDLNETVDGMISMISRLIGEDIHLHWKPGNDLWHVKMDPSQIDQIMVNMCINARDAISDGGTIRIETGNETFTASDMGGDADLTPGDYVKISVIDNGCGMDSETLRHIFEPFFTTKGLGKGTGLGLATVYGIVRQNSGGIIAFSEPGKGTILKIFLPRCHAENVNLNLNNSDKTWPSGRETILLVEDEEAILEVTTMILEMQGYTVITAQTPDEALDLTRNHEGDVHMVLTDVVMPDMNGRDLALHLMGINPNIKQLFMSGYTADVIAHQGVLGDGVHFIQKPFTVKELADKVRDVLDGS